MSWLLKIASPQEYLSSLGAPPPTIEWIMSQPNYQFYINQYRQNPGVDVTTLQPPPQKQQYEPTQRELQRISRYHENIKKWALVELRKMRMRPNPLSNGEMDFDYDLNMTVFDTSLSQIADWFNWNAEQGRPIDIGSFTWEGAIAASNQWHREMADAGANTVYDELDPSLTVFSPSSWNGWFIQKVTSENDLLAEGNQMDHCVAGYCEKVERGETEIFSLRDPQNGPHVTIEIDPRDNSVIQIEGKSNSVPKDNYKELIKQWFDELKKERPGLALYNEDSYDFESLSRVENQEIDEEIDKIVSGSGDYGLQAPLDELDIEYAYDAVIKELTSSNYRNTDTRYVGHIGPSIANAAWEADKYRAHLHGVSGDRATSHHLTPSGWGQKNMGLTPEERLNSFHRESSNKGVDWLWSKIEENNMSFYEYWDSSHSYLNREEFESEEEYELAMQNEEDEAVTYARQESIPYALDDEIASALVKLAREDPFLAEHAKFQVQQQEAVIASSNIWRYVFASPEGWLRSQGVSDEILKYALDDNLFPRKMQKWVALQLAKKFKEDPDIAMVNSPQDFNGELIEIRDWYNHMSRTEPGFDIHRYDWAQANAGAEEWQDRMIDERGEGHASYYTQPDYNAQDLGNGFRMVEVVPDDLQNEGAIMQHCVGDDAQGYRENVEAGKSKIFSLRDSRGWPHATIEVENKNEFNIKEFDNDPGNWIYDDAGNLVDIDHDAYNDRSAQWNINQIQGKQNEPPVNKYRPFLKSWLQNHPEFNPSEDDMLSVTPSPELLQAILNDTNAPDDDGVYTKYSNYLDEEDHVRLLSQVIQDQGVGWSDSAISDAITKPISSGWFDIPDTDESGAGAAARFLYSDEPAVMDRQTHTNFVRSLTSHDSPNIRRAAYSRMSADSRYRTPEGLQEFMQIALQEPSAKVVAVILPNFFTYPNRDSTDSMERWRHPQFSPDLFPFAMQLSEKFQGELDSDELHTKIAIGLAPLGDPQMIATAVTNRFVGQRIGSGSTYEIRHALEKMDSARFGQVWALIDPTLRKFMLSEETKGYNSMVNQHREVIDQYLGETAIRPENGGLAPPGIGVVYQPEHAQNAPVNPGTPDRDDLGQALLNQFGPLQTGPPIGFPGRTASNWLMRIA